MITTLLLSSALQTIPGDPAVMRHLQCLRLEEREPETPGGPREGFNPGDAPLPEIVGMARVIEFCHRERAQAITALRVLVQRRHPDWSAKDIARGAERWLSTLELEQIDRALAPTMTSHGPIDDY